MSSLYRHPENGIFYLAYTDPANGRRHRQSLKTRDAILAARRRRDLEAGLIAAPPAAVSSTPAVSIAPTLEEVRAAYREHSRLHKAPRTALADETRLDAFFDALGVSSLSAVTPALVEAYQVRRTTDVSVATASRDLQTVRAFFRWAMGLDYLAADPCARVKRLSLRGRPRVDFLSLDDLERLLIAAALPVPMRGPGGRGRGRVRPRRTPLVPMIALAAYAGLRLGEIIHLRWDEVELEGVAPTLTVAVTEDFTPKGKKSRVIPVHERLCGILRDYRQEVGRTRGYCFETSAGSRYIRENLLRELKGAARRAGVKRCHWYTLRHTFASQLVMAGVSIYKVARFLGHASVTTTERHYAHLLPEELHEDVNRIGRAG